VVSLQVEKVLSPYSVLILNSTALESSLYNAYRSSCYSLSDKLSACDNGLRLSLVASQSILLFSP